MSRDDWLGWIQTFLEERIDDAPDESCKIFARQLWDMTAESELQDDEE